MGFSVSASFAVVVIAGFIALGMLYPAVSGSFESVSAASQDAGDRRLAAINTDVAVTMACFDTGNDRIHLQAENTGSTGLGLDRTHVLIDNVVQLTFENREVDGISGTAVWAPGETATINFTYTEASNIESVEPDPQRLTVATEHGVFDSSAVGRC